MKGVILAAGISSRLRPLTNSKPKCLLEIGNKTILGRTIECLEKNGISEVIVVTGYYEDQIIQHFKRSAPDIKTKFIFNDIYDKSNNIYSLWLALKTKINDDFILLDSDIIFDWRIIQLLLNSEKKNCLALRVESDLDTEEMKVKIDDHGYISSISKKINPSESIGESIGIEKFSKEFLESFYSIMEEIIVNRGDINIFYEAAFQEAIDSGHKIFAVPVGEFRCIEIDTADDIKSAEAEVVKHLD